MWHQSNFLPMYVFPDWMTSGNHDLQQYNPSVHAAMTRHTLQQQRAVAEGWPPHRIHQAQQREEIERAVRNLPDPPHRVIQSMQSLHRLRPSQNGQQNLKVTVNTSTSSSSSVPSGKRKHADTEDTIGGGPGVKRTRTTDRTQPLEDPRDDRRTAADGDYSSSEEEGEAVDDARSQAERLSSEMLDYMDLHVQKEPDYQEKEGLRRRLETAIREIYQRTNLVLVGSSMNGFGCCGSDADFCLVLTLNEVDQRIDARRILDELHNYLKYRCSFIAKSFVIYAKVPIMRFTDRITGIECDININNMTGIRNTHLVQCYSKVDRRVVPLVMWVKHWFKSNGINDASQGTLSSYAIVLLVIHYLQEICSPPVIPSLQEHYPHLFSPHKDIHSIHRSLNSHCGEPSVSFKSKNTQNLGELIRGFFKHASSFNFTMTLISPRVGGSFKLPSNWRQQYIHLEEPFERQNVARALHKGFQYQKVLAKLSEADKTLSNDMSCSLDDLLSFENPQDGEVRTKKKTKRQRIKEALRFIRRKEKTIKGKKAGPTNSDQHTRFKNQNGQAKLDRGSENGGRGGGQKGRQSSR